MLLRQILKSIGPIDVSGSVNRQVTLVTNDPRGVIPGALYVSHGEANESEFVRASIATSRGAVAVVCRDSSQLSARSTRIRVADPSLALARAAAAFFGYPAHKLQIFRFVPGEDSAANAYRARQILEVQGIKTGLITPFVSQIGEREHPAQPRALNGMDFQRLLSEMVEHGCRACIVDGSVADVSKVFGAGPVRWFQVRTIGEVLRPLGLDWNDGTDASAIPCPGREERIDCGQKFEVLVERAETPLRLEHALRSVRRRVRGHIYVVFGGKASHTGEQRSGYGHVIGRFADGVWITTDDPGNHSPSDLAEEIAFAWRQVRPEPAHRQADRSMAIRSALWRCRPGDALVVAGKGAETFNILADTVVPFDDREECRDCLNQLGFGAEARVRAVIE